MYGRSAENLRRLERALAPLEPALRDAPPGLPFSFDLETIHAGLNFTLTTKSGALDLLGEITGGGRYEDLRPHSRILHLFGLECPCLDLQHLIATKRAAGRPKDLEVIAELEALQEELGEQ